MVACTPAVSNPHLPDDDDLAMTLPAVHWVVERLQERGLELAAAHLDAQGAWAPCSVAELLHDGTLASIGQRPSCGGVVTTVHIWGDAGLHGAFWLERSPGGAETPFFRVLLLQALLRATREETGHERLRTLEPLS